MQGLHLSLPRLGLFQRENMKRVGFLPSKHRRFKILLWPAPGTLIHSISILGNSETATLPPSDTSLGYQHAKFRL